MEQIQIVNLSTSIDAQDLAAMIPALREQVQRDFAPLWGISADIEMVEMISPGAWGIQVLDRCGNANDLGFHLDNANIPMGSVGVLDAQEVQVELSTVISHELLEILADPYTSRMIQQGNNSYVVEVCDPCSGDSYDIGGVKVSNFCTPRYFGYTQMGQFDQLGYLQAGCPTIRPAGMVMWWNGQVWHNTFGRTKEGQLPWRAHYEGRSSWRAKHSKLLGEQNNIHGT